MLWSCSFDNGYTYIQPGLLHRLQWRHISTRQRLFRIAASEYGLRIQLCGYLSISPPVCLCISPNLFAFLPVYFRSAGDTFCSAISTTLTTSDERLALFITPTRLDPDSTYNIASITSAHNSDRRSFIPPYRRWRYNYIPGCNHLFVCLFFRLKRHQINTRYKMCKSHKLLLINKN